MTKLTDELNTREIEILQLVKQGLSNREIADNLYLSLHTVKWYLKQIYGKLDVGSRTQALLKVKTLIETPERQSVPHNLPTLLTPFVGRQAELAQLSSLLLDEATRLVTIHGAGGMGKTHLAMEGAWRMLPYFPDGVYLMSLGGLDDAAQVFSAMAQQLGVSPGSDESALQVLMDYLQYQHSLLVLDNFEHVHAAAAGLSTLLAGAPKLKLVVTSRQRLDLRSEYVLSLEGLAVPAEHDIPDPETHGALQLFTQIAEKNGYTLQPGDEPHIARICQLVDGMPLGIELAASWVNLLAPAQIRQELAHDIDLLSAAAPDVPLRHRSIRATFDYSWGLLSTAERAAALGLAVFRGRFTAPAMQAVTGAGPLALRNLMNKAWLHPASDNRLRVHELLRQYLREHLQADAAQHSALQDAHARYYLHLAAEQAPLVNKGHFLPATQAMMDELDNLRPAWAYAIQQEWWDALDDAWPYLTAYHFKGWWHDAVEIMDDMLAVIPQTHSLTYKLLLFSGLFSMLRNDITGAMRYAAQAGPLLHQAGDEVYVPLLLTLDGLGAAYQQHLPEALALLQDALARTDRLQHAFVFVWVASIYSHLHLAAGQYHVSRALYEDLLALYPQDVNPNELGYVHLAHVCRRMGDLDEAQQHYQICLERSLERRSSGSLVEASYYLNYLKAPDHPLDYHFDKLRSVVDFIGNYNTLGRILRYTAVVAYTSGDHAHFFRLQMLACLAFLTGRRYADVRDVLVNSGQTALNHGQPALAERLSFLALNIPNAEPTPELQDLLAHFGSTNRPALSRSDDDLRVALLAMPVG
ncbi:MAG: LuxR C-terminal-related transcriptional regulator [Anaerolineales bacterium]